MMIGEIRTGTLTWGKELEEIDIKLEQDKRNQYDMNISYSISELIMTAYDEFLETEDHEILHSLGIVTSGIGKTVENDLELKQ
jgi:hypothetical protein